MEPQFTVSTSIAAPKNQVWEVLADLGSIYKWNPGVKTSSTTSKAPRGENATRYCELQRPGGKSVGYLEERAVGWRQGEGYRIQVTESNLPLKTSSLLFSLEADGETTIVTVAPRYKLKGGAFGSLMDKLVGRRQYRKGLEGLLAGLKYHVETGNEVGDRVPS